MPDWVGDIVRRQQDLCDGVAVFGEQLVVGIHQLTLTDCGGSLLGRYICRPLSEAELAHAHADRAGGDEDHLISGILELSTLQSASIWRMFSLPVGCVMVEVPILMTMRIQASLLPYLAVWKYSILRGT